MVTLALLIQKSDMLVTMLVFAVCFFVKEITAKDANPDGYLVDAFDQCELIADQKGIMQLPHDRGIQTISAFLICEPPAIRPTGFCRFGLASFSMVD